MPLFEHSKTQLFTTLCQNPKCRCHLGGMHIPCVGGVVRFICHRCGTVSEFKNTHFGIRPSVSGQLTPAQLRQFGGKSGEAPLE